MDRLVTDAFTRRLSQILVVVVFAAVAIAPFILLVILGAYHAGWVDNARGTMIIAQFFLQALVLPIEDSGAQIGSAFIATFPIVVASVCYILKYDGGTKSASDRLNVLGRTGSVVLIIGGLSALLSVILLGVDADAIRAIVGTDLTAIPPVDDPTPLLKGVFGGLLAFDVLYTTTLLGIRQ